MNKKSEFIRNWYREDPEVLEYMLGTSNRSEFIRKATRALMEKELKNKGKK